MTSKLNVLPCLPYLIVLAVAGCGGSTPAPHAKDSGADTQPDAGGGDAPADGGGSDTAAHSYTIGGTVAGLAGSGLILTDGAGHQVAVAASGAFSFAAPVPAGTSVTVAVSQQPSSPAQVCTVMGGVIPSIAGNVGDVAVTCVTSPFTVAGTVSGLTGTGLVLQNNGGDDLLRDPQRRLRLRDATRGERRHLHRERQDAADRAGADLPGRRRLRHDRGRERHERVDHVRRRHLHHRKAPRPASSGPSLVLQNNAGDDLSVTTNGVFAFATPVHGGDAPSRSRSRPSLLRRPRRPCVVGQGSRVSARDGQR